MGLKCTKFTEQTQPNFRIELYEVFGKLFPMETFQIWGIFHIKPQQNFLQGFSRCFKNKTFRKVKKSKKFRCQIDDGFKFAVVKTKFIVRGLSRGKTESVFRHFTKFNIRKTDSSQNSTLEKWTLHKIQCEKNGLFTKFNTVEDLYNANLETWSFALYRILRFIEYFMHYKI